MHVTKLSCLYFFWHNIFLQNSSLKNNSVSIPFFGISGEALEVPQYVPSLTLCTQSGKARRYDLVMSHAFIFCDGGNIFHFYTQKSCHTLVHALLYLPICEMNISFTSVDSLRTLQSKFRPPGANPPCSITICK